MMTVTQNRDGQFTTSDSVVPDEGLVVNMRRFSDQTVISSYITTDNLVPVETLFFLRVDGKTVWRVVYIQNERIFGW
jgi:hypothetical protein